MKTTKIFLCGIAAMALLSFSTPVKADTDRVSFGITNAALTGSVTATTLGQSSATVQNYADCSIVFTNTVETTNVSSTAVLTFARVDKIGNIETQPRFTWTVALPSSGADKDVSVTNAMVAWTNFPSTIIGSATSLKLISIQAANNNSGYIRRPYVAVQLKAAK